MGAEAPFAMMSVCCDSCRKLLPGEDAHLGRRGRVTRVVELLHEQNAPCFGVSRSELG
jgi:hypothetical protein